MRNVTKSRTALNGVHQQNQMHLVHKNNEGNLSKHESDVLSKTNEHREFLSAIFKDAPDGANYGRLSPFIYRVSAAKNGARYNQVINDPENHFPVEFSDKSPWVARHTAIFLMESDPDWFEHFKPKDLEDPPCQSDR